MRRVGTLGTKIPTTDLKRVEWRRMSGGTGVDPEPMKLDVSSDPVQGGVPDTRVDSRPENVTHFSLPTPMDRQRRSPVSGHVVDRPSGYSCWTFSVCTHDPWTRLRDVLASPRTPVGPPTPSPFRVVTPLVLPVQNSPSQRPPTRHSWYRSLLGRCRCRVRGDTCVGLGRSTNPSPPKSAG